MRSIRSFSENSASGGKNGPEAAGSAYRRIASRNDRPGRRFGTEKRSRTVFPMSAKLSRVPRLTPFLSASPQARSGAYSREYDILTKISRIFFFFFTSGNILHRFPFLPQSAIIEAVPTGCSALLPLRKAARRQIQRRRCSMGICRELVY